MHELHLDGRRTSEDGDRDLERTLVGTDFLDDAAEIRERSIDDLDRFSDLERDLCLPISEAIAEALLE